MSRTTLLAVFAAFCLSHVGAFARAGDVVEARAALYREYAAKLTELATWCARQELGEAAGQLRRWLPERQADQLTLFLLKPDGGKSKVGQAQPAEWEQRWQVLRDAQADALFALAKRAVAEHRPSLAYELVTEAVRENPDHTQGRRMLGYVKFREAWHTPFEIRQLHANKTWHEKFGWLSPAHVDRYAKGQRYYQGRWLSAAAEAELRGDIKRGWRVESEHFIVTTDHSLEEGVALSERLERLYGIWQQVFISYLATEAQLTQRLEGRAGPREPKQHNVVYYRTRDEYNGALRARQPQIDISLGIYFGDLHTAYFFAGHDQDAGTLYHEATHQLFQETRPVSADVGRDSNFWMVEGIACYMESLREHSGYYTLGGSEAGRMPAARQRLLDDDFYVPLAELVRLGMEDLQRDPRIAKVYSQSAGLTDFFMHDARGAYREPLIRYLTAIYAGRATAETLSESTGVDYPTLDSRYREFMQRERSGQAIAPGAVR